MLIIYQSSSAKIRTDLKSPIKGLVIIGMEQKKPVTFSKIQGDDLLTIADVCMEENSKKEGIVNAEEEALTLLYKHDTKNGIGTLLYERFREQILKSSK